MDVKIVLLAASYGGVEALRTILSGLPYDFPAPVVIVQHRSAHLPHLLAHVLARSTALDVQDVDSGDVLKPGTAYIAPPTLHAMVTGGNRLALRDGRRIRHVLSSANPLFESAAANYGPGVIAVVLTGIDSDAAEGARAVKDAGGVVIAQNEATSKSFEMPRAAIASCAVDAVLPLEQIAPALVRLTDKSRAL